MRRPVPHNGGTGIEEGPEGGGNSSAAGVRQTGSAALAVTAGQAGQATIHLHRRLGMALAAQLGAGGIFLSAVVTLCIGLPLGSTTGELGALLLQVGALVFVDLVLRSEEHTSELQSRPHLVCRLLLEKKKIH